VKGRFQGFLESRLFTGLSYNFTKLRAKKYRYFRQPKNFLRSKRALINVPLLSSLKLQRNVVGNLFTRQQGVLPKQGRRVGYTTCSRVNKMSMRIQFNARGFEAHMVFYSLPSGSDASPLHGFRFNRSLQENLLSEVEFLRRRCQRREDGFVR